VSGIDTGDPPQHGDGWRDDRLAAHAQHRTAPEAGVADGDGAIDDTTVDIDDPPRQPEGSSNVSDADVDGGQVDRHVVGAAGPADGDIERRGSVHGTGVGPGRRRSEK
jgi:hypothetical protein